ncbi:hypothetical protein HDU97_004991 [Phlyctochytrium planicorne]|nr:hypothetical protein HDU97_004991 [Phlyctochytrium planicorne]
MSYVSTSTASFQKHDVQATFEDYKSERDQYLKNKLKANHGGDWWSQKAAENHQELESSNYTVSFGGSAGDASHGDQWNAHRRRKAASQDDGKSYNILTGAESGAQSVSGRYDPNRSAKRVSAEKLEFARNEAMGRVYNIISNV